jgi:hypothetical protein
MGIDSSKDTDCVFHRFWAALTLLVAVSNVKGGVIDVILVEAKSGKKRLQYIAMEDWRAQNFQVGDFMFKS